MTPELLRIVDRRLEATGALEQAWSLLVLGACESTESLTAVLDGHAPAARKKIKATEHQPADRPGAYLDSITVEGFRGVGPRRTLELTPTAGLTLIVGRNGSGKSSFAEGLEILLTGDNWRWRQDRSKVWREAWRNLHHTATTAVEAQFVIDGQKGETSVARHWADGAALNDSTVSARGPDKKKVDLDDLGWTSAAETFRPFLSYNELGSTFDEGPTEFHDRLSRILGLGDIEDAQQLLKRARLQRQATFDDAKGKLAGLLQQLEPLPDPRAQAAHKALKGKTWDLAAAEKALDTATDGAAPSDELPLLRFLAALPTPDPDEVRRAAEDLLTVAAREADIAAQPAGEARELVQILQLAIKHFDSHGEGDCPVCGKRLALLPSWRARSETKINDLRERAREADQVAAEAAVARRRIAGFVSGPPAQLADASVRLNVDATALLDAWHVFAAHDAADSESLPAHLTATVDALAEAAADFRERAKAELDRREAVWAPIARALAAWLATAPEAQEAQKQVADLKSAEAWLKDTSGEIRAERFGPIATEAIKLWELLRQQSSVELQSVLLTGSGTSRQVKIDVTIDGVPSAALGVMSQGELHAMALSLFLPRATLPESPFRFVVIDDPVQSMDPGRVDGLARVLDEVAQHRQVIVFTHDDRLPESVRRLGIDARQIDVTRRENSVVDLTTSVDPIQRNLDDAHAIAADKDLPPDLARQIVPGYCRAAIEAQAIEIVRRRRIGRGETHTAVDTLLEMNDQLRPLLSLVLFDNAGRGNEVSTKVSGWGVWAAEVLDTVTRGAHTGAGVMPLDELVPNTRKFCTRLRELAK